MKRLALAVGSFLAAGLLVSAQTQKPIRPVLPLLGVGGNQPSEPGETEFFNGNKLQEIRLEIASKDWQTLKDNYQSNTYYPCTFIWNGQTVRNVGIRSRGNSSRSPVKPSLRVDFDRYATDQKFLGLKSVVLRNNSTDPSSMHERISFLLFERMGIQVPRETHARMYVNNEYMGLYTLVESLDKHFLQRVYGNDSGYLYQFDRRLGDPPYYFTFFGDDPSLYVPHPFQPETHESDPLPEEIRDLIVAINYTDDASWESVVGDRIDIPKFVKYAAIENFLADYDSFIGRFGMNNFYFYRLSGSHRHDVLAWDKSEAMSDRKYDIFQGILNVSDDEKNRLMDRAIAFPHLRKLYLDTLDAVATSAIEPIPGDPRGWMERETEREYLQIKDAAANDPAVPSVQFESAVEGVRLFARERSPFVKAAVSAAR
jgi:spore coat protein CotH